MLDSKDFLSNLILTGSDASLNLFTVCISLAGDDENTDSDLLEYRITDVPNIISRDSTAVSLPYQGTSIDVISPGTSIPKTLSFTLRVDDKYKVLSTLRKYQCINNLGMFQKSEDKKINYLLFKVYRNNSEKSHYEEIYAWQFFNCYILTLSPLTYSYGSASPATINVTVVWNSYTEYLDIPETT